MPLKVTPVLLAGGKGTRLRPLTGRGRPKPFVKVFSQLSMFQTTALRFARYEAPVVVTHRSCVSMARKDLHALGIKDYTIIAEASHQGTAAAVSSAALALQGQNTMMLVSPIDHMIGDEQALHDLVDQSLKAQNQLFLIGAQPDYAAERYGYIEHDGAGKLRSFHEKPHRLQAQDYLKRGNFLWHTGMFLCAPHIFLEKLQAFEPDLFEAVKRSFDHAQGGAQFMQPEPLAGQSIRPVSVDHAVMERLEEARVLTLDSHWSDTGTWPSYIRSVLVQNRRPSRKGSTAAH